MKLSNGYWQTYKETPSDATIPSHKLMLRAGLIHKSAAGLYNMLPMGHRVVRKVEQIVREEMEEINAHEVSMTLVTPGELWKKSGRWDGMAGEMLTSKDKNDRDVCISPTNEEAITDIFSKTVKSYKELPVSLYQINKKFRDEIRPRFGLMRSREFIMKDAYSFHESKESLREVYNQYHAAYSKICERLNLEYMPVEADAGAMADAGALTHEFQAIAPSGEDKVIKCSNCDYAANVEKAETKRVVAHNEVISDLEKIETPNKSTIEDVCEFLNSSQHQSLKSLVYAYSDGKKDQFVLAMLLGDDSLNELKLNAYLKGSDLRPATDNDLMSLDLVKGFIGPKDLKADLTVLFDNSINPEMSYITGANEADFHFKNFVPTRDGMSFERVDLRDAKEGDTCSKCDQASITETRGIEVGHIFELGDKYTKSMEATVLDKNGKTMNPLMGCYGFGVTRAIGAVIEAHNDEGGIVWPASIAPYQIHFTLISKNEEFIKMSHDLYDELKSAGFEVLLDDRKAGPGFKFKDADLLGLPLRLTLGERDYKEDSKFEICVRKSGEKVKVTKDELISNLKSMLEKL